MTFSEFANMLYPFCGDGSKTSAFVVSLVENFMEEPANDADEKKAQNGEYNPLANLEESTQKDYYNGKRPFAQKNASIILGRMDKPKFADYIEKFSTDAQDSLCSELKKRGSDANLQNIGLVCADLFEQAIRLWIGNEGQPPPRFGKEEYAEEIMPSLEKLRSHEAPIATAYISGGRLHIGGKSIRLNDKLVPPTDVTGEEMGYVPKLLDAYCDAEKPQKITQESLQDFPMYRRNFGEQREHYYNAVYVIENVRSKFGNEFGEQLDILKKEIYDGISDAYWNDHPHGFARLNAVMMQVVGINATKSLLWNIKNLISVSERKGVCHILVSDGTIKSWVERL